MCRPSLRNSLHCENKDLLALLCSSQVSTCQGFVMVKGIHITEVTVVREQERHKMNIVRQNWYSDPQRLLVQNKVLMKANGLKKNLDTCIIFSQVVIEIWNIMPHT